MSANSEPEPMAYIGRSACGCIVEAWVDRSARRDEIAEALRAMVLEGYTVERVTVEYVRENLKACPHKDRQLELVDPGPSEN